jgi:hypothetical protein
MSVDNIPNGGFPPPVAVPVLANAPWLPEADRPVADGKPARQESTQIFAVIDPASIS